MFVGKPISLFVYHFYLKTDIIWTDWIYSGQNFIKKCKENASNAMQITTNNKILLSRIPD